MAAAVAALGRRQCCHSLPLMCLQEPLVYQPRDQLYCVRAVYGECWGGLAVLWWWCPSSRDGQASPYRVPFPSHAAEPLQPDNPLAGLRVINTANENSVTGPPVGTNSGAGAPQIIATLPNPQRPSKLRVGFTLDGERQVSRVRDI